jgi:hypothetical protein
MYSLPNPGDRFHWDRRNVHRFKFPAAEPGPDRDVVIVPVRTSHADAVHLIADLTDLLRDDDGQEMKGDFGLHVGPFLRRHDHRRCRNVAILWSIAVSFFRTRTENCAGQLVM